MLNCDTQKMPRLFVPGHERNKALQYILELLMNSYNDGHFTYNMPAVVVHGAVSGVMCTVMRVIWYRIMRIVSHSVRIGWHGIMRVARYCIVRVTWCCIMRIITCIMRIARGCIRQRRHSIMRVIRHSIVRVIWNSIVWVMCCIIYRDAVGSGAAYKITGNSVGAGCGK